jgi:DNA invertase Pin-like site-specific DNA recombinase
MEYCFDNNLNCMGVYQDVYSGWNMRNSGLGALHEMLGDMGLEAYFPKKCRCTHPLVKRMRDAISASKELLLLRTEEPDPGNHVHYILVANIDRFGRDVKNLLAIKHQLATYNTRIVSVCQRILTGTDTGDFSFHREALEAELFSMDRSIRIKSVKRAKKALGNYLGGVAPFGHMIENVAGKRTLTVSPEEQRIAKKIDTLSRQRKTPKQIAGVLNSEGSLRRGKQWTASQISYINRKAMQDINRRLSSIKL